MSEPRTDVHEIDLKVLERIYSSKANIHQRDLAEIAGVSLGMTNAILKRLAQKGLLTIRKVNNRNIRYIVSPKGIEAITRKSYRYFKRTIKNVVIYRETIEAYMHNLKRDGFSNLVLIGASDMDFIVEHACERYGITYKKETKAEDERTFYLYSESYIPDEEPGKGIPVEDSAFLQEVLINGLEPEDIDEY